MFFRFLSLLNPFPYLWKLGIEGVLLITIIIQICIVCVCFSLTSDVMHLCKMYIQLSLSITRARARTQFVK